MRLASGGRAAPCRLSAARGHISATGRAIGLLPVITRTLRPAIMVLLGRVAQAQQPGEEQAPRPPSPRAAPTDTGLPASRSAERANAAST